MEIYQGHTTDHREQLKRHDHMFDTYDERFDALDSQVSEVLGILRGKTG